MESILTPICIYAIHVAKTKIILLKNKEKTNTNLQILTFKDGQKVQKNVCKIDCKV